MKDFEFRFFEPDGTVAIDRYKILSNYTAIVAGQTRSNGRRFEIWCGEDCIYKSDVKSVGSLEALSQNRESANR